MLTQEGETPMANVIREKDKTRRSVNLDPSPPKRAKKPKPAFSYRARAYAAFEAKLEPWVLAGKPLNSKILFAIWWLYAILRLDKVRWIPQPRTVWSFNAEADRIMQRIRAVRHQTMAIITVMTAKGGATKTTTSSWFGATSKQGSGLPVFIFDTNSGGGKVSGRLNLNSEEVLTSKQLANMVTDGKTPTFHELLNLTKTDELTVVMVSHHAPGDVIGYADTALTLLMLKRMFHTVVVDTSPSLEDSSVLGASFVSDVFVLVGKASSNEDMEDIETALNDKRYGLREQLDSVVISLSDIPPHHCGTRTQYEYAERFKVNPDQIVLVPFDPHLKKVGKVRRDALTPRARMAMSQLSELIGTTVINLRDESAPGAIV